MRRTAALLSSIFLVGACTSGGSKDVSSTPAFAPTAMRESEIAAPPPDPNPLMHDNGPRSLDELIDRAYGAVVVDVIDSRPRKFAAANDSTMSYYTVRVVENIFGGYQAGKRLDVIMGYEQDDPTSPFHFSPEFVKNERLLLFTQHSEFEQTGVDYPEAEAVVGARDGLYRFVDVAGSDATQNLMPQGYLDPITLEALRTATLERVLSQGVDPEQRNEQR